MVTVELGKRDFVWMSFVVVLIGVGFVYGYGGSNPAVMGHSAGEVVVNWNDIVGMPAGFADGVDDVGEGGGTSLDLVNGFRSSSQCLFSGGEIVDDGSGNSFCKFSMSGCPSRDGWVQYKSWSTTSPNKCTHYMTTSSHGFANKNTETGTYTCCTGDSFAPDCKQCTCYAKTIEIGCY
jgi:hypothetical protein